MMVMGRMCHNIPVTMPVMAMQTEPGSNRIRLLEFHSLLHHRNGQVCVWYLPVEIMVQGFTVRIRPSGGGSLRPWPMFCWEALGLSIHVDISLARHLPKHCCISGNRGNGIT